MKKIICSVIIGIAFFLQSNAQYLPLFKNDTTKWKVHFAHLDNFFVHYEIVNNTLYSEDNPNSYLKDSIPIRTNTSNSKAWITPNATNQEILIFDLDLAVNDTFKQYKYSELLTMDSTDLIVDSVYFWEGRKVISFGVGKLVGFIEGVGPIGFFLNGYKEYSDIRLVCKTELDEVKYHIDTSLGYKNCKSISTSLYGVSSIPSITINSIIENTLHLSIDSKLQWNAKLSNFYGKEIDYFLVEKEYYVNYAHLSKGLYFLQLQNETNLITFKLLKK